jgi:hypothetical protein
MKNVFKFLGIIALVAVIGFSMVSCGGDDDDSGGGGGGGGKLRWRSELAYTDYGSDGSNGDWKINTYESIPKITFNNSPSSGDLISINLGIAYTGKIIELDDKPAGQTSSFKVKLSTLATPDEGELTVKYKLAADGNSFEITESSRFSTAEAGHASVSILGTYRKSN